MMASQQACQRRQCNSSATIDSIWNTLCIVGMIIDGPKRKKNGKKLHWGSTPMLFPFFFLLCKLLVRAVQKKIRSLEVDDT